MKNIFIKATLTAVICMQFNIYGSCQGQQNNGQSVLFELNWGRGANEVTLVPKDVDDPLAGSGPDEFVVDEKNGFVYIYDWANDFRMIKVDFNGNGKHVITRKERNGTAGMEFNVDTVGNFYVHNRGQKGDNKILVFDPQGNLAKTIILNPKAYMQEMYIDSKGFIWAGVYFDESFKINPNGETIKRFGQDKRGIDRSKGKYFLKYIEKGKEDISGGYRAQCLYDAKENLISKLPASATIVGVDNMNNCYLNVWDSSDKKQYIWIVDSSGKTLLRRGLGFKLHDQENFPQIFISESGNIYIAPNSDANNKFKIVKISSINK